MELLTGEFVQRRERFVHQQYFRANRQRPCDSDTLLHSSGKLVRIVVREVRESHHLQHAVRDILAFVLRDVHYLQRKHYVPADCAPVVEHRALEHYPVPLRQPCLPGSYTAHGDLSGGGVEQIRNYSQKSGLAAARGTEQRNELALLDIQRYIGERCDIISALILVHHADSVQHDLCVLVCHIDHSLIKNRAVASSLAPLP